MQRPASKEPQSSSGEDHEDQPGLYDGERRGGSEKDGEVVLIAKTKESLVKDLVEKVKSVHSYSVPCVVSLPILDGNRAFLDWIIEETR